MPLERRRLRQELTRKFDFAEDDSKSHIWYRRKFPGLPPVRTKVSHHDKQLSDTLCSKIAKELRVSRPFLLEMISCTKSCAEYEEHLRSDPTPPFPAEAPNS